MKNKFFFKFIIFVLFLHNIGCLPSSEKKGNLNTDQKITYCQDQLCLEKNFSAYKLVMIPSLVCSFFWFNQKKLLENIKNHPLFLLIGACIISNFYIDAVIKYKELNETILLFQLSKIISRYLLYAIAIKNTMLQIAKRDTCCDFKEDDFFKIITEEMPLSFQELELLVSELLHTCIKTIHGLHIKIHTDIEEQIYLLCKEHITLQDVLNFYENDKNYYPFLQKLQENPNQYYKKAAHELNTLIKEQFQYMIKRS